MGTSGNGDGSFQAGHRRDQVISRFQDSVHFLIRYKAGQDVRDIRFSFPLQKNITLAGLLRTAARQNKVLQAVKGAELIDAVFRGPVPI